MRRDANMPKKSERPIDKWLNLIGVKDVRPVGNEGHGPPDFVGCYDRKVVAVESVLLPTKPKKAVTRNIGIEERVRQMVEDLDAKHIYQVFLEYDRKLPKKHLRFDAWRDDAARAVRCGLSGKWYQILPEGKRNCTTGIEICFLAGGVPRESPLVVSVQESLGEIIGDKPMQDSIKNVVDIIREKSEKVKNGERARHYGTWWLVIDGDLLMERGHLLFPGEMEGMSEAVRSLEESRQWSKIVVMSRMTGDHFHCLWETDEQPRLTSPP